MNSKPRSLRATLSLALLLLSPTITASQSPPLASEIDKLVLAVEPELLQWRRHLHQYPELSNREIETSKYIAERLKTFGLEPQTGVAKTGVVALLRGGRPGPVVALRADMDGLPVREEVNLPFASKATGQYEGNTVGVMHACGHDTHVAILLATARVLTQMKDRLPGSVKFIFQPAEEGAPLIERPAGAELMVTDGVMQNPKVDAVFGLHVFANVPTGTITYRSGPFMAASDQFDIIVTGKQTHGSAPWRGIDPIVVGAQIVTSLQTIVSRSVDITHLPVVVSVGQFQSGVRNNIIPETARLVGTIRTFDDAMQNDVHARVKRIAESVAAGAGATVDVKITRGPPVTANDPALTARMLPTLERVAPGKVKQSELITGAEDFTFFQRQAPGLFVFLGITPPEQAGKAPAQSLAAVFRGREGAPDGRARAGASRGGLLVGGAIAVVRAGGHVPNRREFFRRVMVGAAGAYALGRGRIHNVTAVAARQAQGQSARRQVTVAGRRVRVIDMHAHCVIPVQDVVAGTPLAGMGGGGGNNVLGPQRLQVMDQQGVDVQALSINGYWWYAADQDLARRIVRAQNEGLAKWVTTHPERFVALASVALQHPQLAAEQLQDGVQRLGLRGASIGGHVNGEDLSLPKYDPFWAKAAELGVVVFMHPGGAENIVKPDAFRGRGDLGNIIGNPLETTYFLSRLIFDGTFDKFPGLRVCGAHAGGYLPSYFGRTEAACAVRSSANCANKKKPSEYLRSQILADTMVFSDEGLRHLVAEMGVGQVVYGTDVPFNWPVTVDLVLNASFLSDADKTAILSGNLMKLLKISSS